MLICKVYRYIMNLMEPATLWTHKLAYFTRKGAEFQWIQFYSTFQNKNLIEPWKKVCNVSHETTLTIHWVHWVDLKLNFTSAVLARIFINNLHCQRWCVPACPFLILPLQSSLQHWWRQMCSSVALYPWGDSSRKISHFFWSTVASFNMCF